jgi:hypothetical protein
MISMNYLVFLDAKAGELEKILSGVKTMLVKEFDPAHTPSHPLNPGDSLYFLRNKDECALRVKATVVRVLFLTNSLDEDLSHALKEMQTKLQFTEDQFNHWSAKKQVALVEFEDAQKIPEIRIAPDKIKDRTEWIAFEDVSFITQVET